MLLPFALALKFKNHAFIFYFYLLLQLLLHGLECFPLCPLCVWVCRIKNNKTKQKTMEVKKNEQVNRMQ